MREDKNAGEIVREVPLRRPGPAPVVLPRASAAPMVAGVRITNPDKILYPEPGISKLALAEYYDTIADYILPYIIHRPLTLLRCPDGYQGECFYQKHFREPLPEPLRAISIPEKNETVDYIVIDDRPGLIALVQLGVLEIHPWGSRDTDPDRPDILVFDLDPGPEVAWSAVIEAARLLRLLLVDVGLQSFVKTSGGKGLHVVLPIESQVGWQEARSFARAIAQELVRRRTDLFTLQMKKAKRQGKILLDYLRNDRGATAVAPYSTRARAGAPVSTPLRWEELGRVPRADRYRLANLPKRLAALADDPWPDFFRIHQGLGPLVKKGRS